MGPLEIAVVAFFGSIIPFSLLAFGLYSLLDNFGSGMDYGFGLFWVFAVLALGIAGGGGYLAYFCWESLYLPEETTFGLLCSVACTFAIAAAVFPLECLVFKKVGAFKALLVWWTIPAAVISGLLVLNAYTKFVWFESDEFLTVAIVLFDIGVFFLALSLSAHIGWADTLEKIFLKKIAVPPLLILAWVLVVFWYAKCVEKNYDNDMLMVLLFACMCAVTGMGIGGLLYSLFGLRKIAGFFAALGGLAAFWIFAVLFYVEFYYVTKSFLWAAVAVAGCVIAVGLLYILIRIKKVIAFVKDGIKKYWIN